MRLVGSNEFVRVHPNEELRGRRVLCSGSGVQRRGAEGGIFVDAGLLAKLRAGRGGEVDREGTKRTRFQDNTNLQPV